MAYPRSDIRRYARSYRRKAYTPVRRTPGTSLFYKKPKPMRTVVPTLARTISRIKRKVLGMDETVQYSQSADATIGNLTGTNAFYYPLARFGDWGRIFGTDSSDETNHQCIWRKTNIDMELNNNGERNDIDYSLYIVSLTKAGAATLLNYATGNLNGPLVNGVHYSIGGTYGLGFLNKKYFNILACRRFMTGTNSGSAAEVASLRKRYYFKFPWNKGKGKYIKNPSGDWRSTVCPQVPGNNLFVLCFNNDSTSDTAVHLRWNAIHTVEV